ncbi:MAG: TonB-dependent receptor, partial [Sphingomonas sp.]
MKICAYLMLLPGLALGTPALGQSAQTTNGLEKAADAAQDIVVTANRAARPAETVGQSVTVLDTEIITQRQAVVVSDLLRQ